MITVAGHLLQKTIGLTAEGTKGANDESHNSHADTGGRGTRHAKIVLGATTL